MLTCPGFLDVVVAAARAPGLFGGSASCATALGPRRQPAGVGACWERGRWGARARRAGVWAGPSGPVYLQRCFLQLYLIGHTAFSWHLIFDRFERGRRCLRQRVPTSSVGRRLKMLSALPCGRFLVNRLVLEMQELQEPQRREGERRGEGPGGVRGTCHSRRHCRGWRPQTAAGSRPCWAGSPPVPAGPSAPAKVDLATGLQVTVRAWWWPCPLPLECPGLGSLCASFRPWGQSPAEQAEVAEAAAGLRER